MMPIGSLGRMLRQNLRRNIRHFFLSAVGITIGIAAFVFFLGLSGGVRKVVLGDIFPIDRVEVIAPKTTLTGITPILNDKLNEAIRTRPEVAESFPKLKLAFPAKGWGWLLGREIHGFEVGGFCDGIDPALVKDESYAALFQDFEETERDKIVECGPEPTNACPDDQTQYCGWDHKCHRRVPVLFSRTLIEIYNGSFAPAHNMPRVGAAQQMILEKKMKDLRFHIGLGESVIAGAAANIKARPEHIEAQLVGLSDKAMPIGITVPIGYVKRWNAAYAGEQSAREYSSIVVRVKDKDEVASFVSWVKRQGFETEESYAERFALVIQIVTLLLLLIAMIIIGLSAVNIAHTFFMLIAERRREIGIMRAVGATRSDVRLIFLGEAGVIGLAAGVFGVTLGVLAGHLVDFISHHYVSDFPFKPTTYFDFSPWLVGGALVFAVLFCLLGASLPARQAGRMEPAQALTA